MRTEVLEIRGYGFEASEFAGVPPLSFKKLLIEVFSHGQQETAGNAPGYQSASLSGPNELTKQSGINHEYSNNQMLTLDDMRIEL